MTQDAETIMGEARPWHAGRGHRPLFLWATPRSVSTAFAKCMSMHRSIDVLHEPFTNLFYFGPDRRSSRYGNPDIGRAGDSLSREAVNQSLVGYSREKRLFIKELAFQGEPFINDELINHCEHAVILRHPFTVAASLAKLKPDFTEEEFGFTAVQRIVHRCIASAKLVPVFDGDRFRDNPTDQLGIACGMLGITSSAGMTSWNSGRLRPWEPHERDSQAKWHHTLETSKGILPASFSIPSASQLGLTPNQRSMLDRAIDIYRDLIEECHKHVGLAS